MRTITNPPPHVLTDFVTEIWLGDLEGFGEVVCVQRLSTYKGKIYDFALMVRVTLDGEVHEVERVDCCDGEVHRHRFGRTGAERRHHIAPVEPNFDPVVPLEYERAYDHVVDDFPSMVDRWWKS